MKMMMNEITENKYESRDLLTEDLSRQVIDILSISIDERDFASMLLSGGTTPAPLYEKMSNADLNWSKIWFGPTDERWVNSEHDDSNEKLIRDTLLKNKASVAHYCSLKSDHDDPFLGQALSRENISKLPLPFDIVLLGMGEDGHVASLFPGLGGTMAAMSPDNDHMCAAIIKPNGDVARMTMTLNNLLTAKRIFLLFYGAKKLEIYQDAKKTKTDLLPVSSILHQTVVPVSLYWAE